MKPHLYFQSLSFCGNDLQPYYHPAVQGLENNTKPSACAPVGLLVTVMLCCKYITATHMLEILLQFLDSYFFLFSFCLQDGGRCAGYTCGSHVIDYTVNSWNYKLQYFLLSLVLAWENGKGAFEERLACTRNKIKSFLEKRNAISHK